MKTRLVILCSAALLATAAFADDKMDTRRGGDAFSTLDADGDGKISKDEAAANEHIAKSFDRLDGNSDGYVTKREFQRNTMKRQKAGL